jgi:putative transposase
MTKKLTNVKKRLPWLYRVNAQSLQSALWDMDEAYKNFFAKRSRLPRFKQKRGRQSFRVPQRFRFEEGQLKIPKISPLKIVLHRPLPEIVKNVTIIRETDGRYYASFCCKVEDPKPTYEGNVTGIDLGLKDFLVDNEGNRVSNPKHLEKSLKKLRRLQRKHSRRKKGSRRREKARLALARQHARVRHQRSDFLHKLSHRLIHENQVIAVEDLNVRGMVRNRNLSRRVGAVGWGEFVLQLEYKGSWYGCKVIKVDRFFPSSKTCSCCGWVKEDLRLSDLRWKCGNCGSVVDRDHNAAINILTAGSAGINASEEGKVQALPVALNEAGSHIKLRL